MDGQTHGWGGKITSLAKQTQGVRTVWYVCNCKYYSSMCLPLYRWRCWLKLFRSAQWVLAVSCELPLLYPVCSAALRHHVISMQRKSKTQSPLQSGMLLLCKFRNVHPFLGGMGEEAQVAVITGTNVLKMTDVRKFHSSYKILPHAWD